MGTSKAQTKDDSNELNLKGRTIKAHLDSANKYRDKYNQHVRSAGILLIEAKALVEHGQWITWLEGHGINRRTAARVMGEHEHPERVDIRRAEQTERNHKAQAEANEPLSDPFESTPSPRKAPKLRSVKTPPPRSREPKQEKTHDARAALCEWAATHSQSECANALKLLGEEDE